jgi:hypothetical protein
MGAITHFAWSIGARLGRSAAAAPARALAKPAPAAAPAPAQELAKYKSTLTIASDGTHEVKLLVVNPATRPFKFSREDMRHVWCLVVAEGEFDLDEAIKWVADAKRINRRDKRQLLPSIVASADVERLSIEDRYRVKSELEPAGARLCKWPHNCRSVKDALDSLRAQLASSYGEVNFSDRVKWGRTRVGEVAA